jgi:hypothetical protein
MTKLEKQLQDWDEKHPDSTGLYPLVHRGEVVGTIYADEENFGVIDDAYAVPEEGFDWECVFDWRSR